VLVAVCPEQANRNLDRTDASAAECSRTRRSGAVSSLDLGVRGGVLRSLAVIVNGQIACLYVGCYIPRAMVYQ